MENTMYTVSKYRLKEILLMNISKHHRLDQIIIHLMLSDVLTIDLKQHIFHLVVAAIRIAKITTQAYARSSLEVTYKHDHHQQIWARCSSPRNLWK